MDAMVEQCPRMASASQQPEVPTPMGADRVLPTVGRGGVVPYITTWSGEQESSALVVGRGRLGIGFADERADDRDEHGVLWTRLPSRPGDGLPEFRGVHPARQREAMLGLLCQICAQPADHDEQGVLWLLTDDREDWPNWPEDLGNTFPPLCLPCARLSVRLCPPLRKGYVAVRAQRFPVRGVYGMVYVPGRPVPTPVGDHIVRYEDPAVRWTRAVQLVRTLHECTIVDLNQLSDNHGQNPGCPR
jgi:hypothetical protein